MNTLRGYINADTSLSFWIRDASGKRTLTGKTLTFRVYAYGKPGDPLAEIVCASPATGKVTGTIPAATAYDTLGPSLYRYDLQAEEGDATEILSEGVLELV